MWTIDLKDKGTVYKGPARAPAKANVTLLMSDETFEQLAAGKVCLSFAFLRSFISLFSLWLDASASGVFGSVGITALGHIWVLSDGSTLFFFLEQLDGQKAFMTGKLKTKGNVMLATKLGAVLEVSYDSPDWAGSFMYAHRSPGARPSSRLLRCIVYLPVAFMTLPVHPEW